MILKKLLSIQELPDKLLANIESRDVALWIRDLPDNPVEQETILSFLNLPWKLVLLEITDSNLIDTLENPSNNTDQMLRKRGFIQIIDSDPSRIQLPQRCLPIYLLNGRGGDKDGDFENQLRQLTMVETLRRSDVKELLVVSDTQNPIPPKLKEIQASGFQSFLTVVSNNPQSEEILDDLTDEIDIIVSLSSLPTLRIIKNVIERYFASYPDEKLIIRMRSQSGEFNKIDISMIDDPERPILENHSLIFDKDLSPLMPEELPELDFIEFFQNSENSWKPYAAGLPWERDSIWKDRFASHIKKLDSYGADENFVAYIASEPGAGGTTAARSIAWEYAKKGYPVLVSKSVPFVPDYVGISNFLLNVHRESQKQITPHLGPPKKSESSKNEDLEENKSRSKYETPWILVYDRVHWEYKETELRKFCKKFSELGRPIAVLVIMGSKVENTIQNDSATFKHIGVLNHILDQEEALALGKHFNKFLRVFHKERKIYEWRTFYEEHAIQDVGGQSSFWITLSFWLQYKYDMKESIQEWMYKSLKSNIKDMALIKAIFKIAAMSSERLPMPMALLPDSNSKYPMSYVLNESKSMIPSIGLIQVKKDGDNYWTLVHDILGRFLINALYYDKELCKKMDVENAIDAEHLRFMILKGISKNSILGEKSFEPISERFATHIFKIDFDFGRGSFARFWPDVLEALDNMPKPIQQNNRVFLHHTSISRRRIVKLTEDFFNVTDSDRISLLERAINDINYAIQYIEYTPGSESNLNLYNSLARAYLDLADLKLKMGEDFSIVATLREKANEAIRTAYNENPTNSHVLETYVKNLLLNAKGSPDNAIDNCIEALGTIFSTISMKNETYRVSALGSLADEALEVLFTQTAYSEKDQKEPANAVEVLVKAWLSISKNHKYSEGLDLATVPLEDRKSTIEILDHPSGRGNMQVIRLTYQLICETYPGDFKRQLDLSEQLEKTTYRISPQQKLEYAILLYQNYRHEEGGKIFVSLRQLWRETDHFVYVPKRLRWLWEEDGFSPKKVTAFVVSDYGYRAMASVQNFSRQRIPFRPEEFGLVRSTAKNKIVCHVTFGNNGPFLRPVTAGPGHA